jgi:hypothetical protein
MTVYVISDLQADFLDTEICDWIADLHEYSIDLTIQYWSKNTVLILQGVGKTECEVEVR